MNIFEKLLEIKTGKSNLSIKLIYINKLDNENFLSYSSYYYDNWNNTFYINWLDNKNIKFRKNLEIIINESYTQESKELENSLTSISKTKKPKVYLFLYSDNEEFVVINEINIKPIRSRKWEILKLKVWM